MEIRNPVENKTNWLKPRAVSYILWVPRPKPMISKSRNKKVKKEKKQMKLYFDNQRNIP